MKNCELCKLQARTYCESDQASLCWDCDSKVHGANFLVARHSRTLLCNVCHSLTPWKASGEKLGNTVSVCDSCINGQEEESRETNGDDDNDADDDDTEEEIDEDDEEEEEEGENQVVPWSTLTARPPPPPPPAYDSSSSDDVSDPANVLSVKRRRLDGLDLQSQAASASSSEDRGNGTVPPEIRGDLLWRRGSNEGDQGEVGNVNLWGRES